MSTGAWHCLWGRGQRGNSAAHLLVSSPLFSWLSCKTGSISHRSNPSLSPQSAVSLSFPLSQSLLSSSAELAVSPAPQPPPRGFPKSAHVVRLTSLVVLVDFFFNSLVVRVPCIWFSGAFGCLLILDWLLSSFWLCEEVKSFYLHLHFGWNSQYQFFHKSYCILEDNPNYT